jgi:hypothetical protein
LVQDHVKSSLLFVGTEFGVYFSPDSGQKWMKLKAGMPTIAIRDLAIQKRENDLVAASFGRSFYVLDDYSALRDVSEEQMKQEATLFATRKAWWYDPRSIVSAQGASDYAAENPPFGAVFTYHLSEGLKTVKSERQKKEKDLAKDNKDIPFPGWDAVEAERRQDKPVIWLTVKDNSGNVVHRIEGGSGKGFHRVAWDLRHSSKSAIRLQQGEEQQEFGRFNRNRGLPAIPGTYTATLSKEVDGVITDLSKPMSFEVVPMRKGALEAKPAAVIAAYRVELEYLQSAVAAANFLLDNSLNRVKAMETALSRSDADVAKLVKEVHALKQTLYDLDQQMNGNRSKQEIGEEDNPTIQGRMGVAFRGVSTYGPTALHKKCLEIAKTELAAMQPKLEKIAKDEIPRLEKALQDVGAPWIEGASGNDR